MTAAELATLLAALGFGGALVAVVNAFSQRRKVGADTTAVVTAAARELVDPLRKELALERAEHAKEIEAERRKVAEMRAELEACTEEAKVLRNELAMARVEADALRREREMHRSEIRQNKAEIRTLRHQLGL